jgi:secreted trypsin-like serine protease
MMTMRRAHHALLFLGATMLALAGTACASPSDASDADSSESNDALVGGTKASLGQFPATVYLKSGCTATKVAPKRLLTAAHCVLDPATVSIRFRKGSKISVAHDPAKGFVDVEIADAHVHPTWLKACEDAYCAASSVTARLDAADVAVLELATDLDDVPIAPVAAAPLAAGERVTVLGYGCTVGVLVPDNRDALSLKYAETTLVPADRAVHEGSAVLASDVEEVAGNYSLTAGPGAAKTSAGLCPGDSGGAMYAKRDGALVVVGVNSNYTLGPEESDQVGLPITNWHTRLDDASRHEVGAWLRSVGVPTVAPASAH